MFRYFFCLFSIYGVHSQRALVLRYNKKKNPTAPFKDENIAEEVLSYVFNMAVPATLFTLYIALALTFKPMRRFKNGFVT